MRKTGVIACFALLLANTGTRAGPLFESGNGTELASDDDNAIGVFSNATSAGAVTCLNGTDSSCSSGFHSNARVTQNTTANVTKVPVFDSIVDVIQNSTGNDTNNLFWGQVEDNAPQSASHLPANITCCSNASVASGHITDNARVTQNTKANVTKVPVFDSIVGVIQNSTGNDTNNLFWGQVEDNVPDSASLLPANITCCSNASVASGHISGSNTQLRNDTTGEYMLNDDLPEINEAVDGNSSACPPLVSRDGWGGRPPRAVEKLQRKPVPFVVIHHTYIPAACNTSDDCEAKMRSMQDFHMGKGWNNIGYNFIVGGDNRVYVGRGWDVVGAHSPVYNFKSVGISFIGDYRTELPTQDMMELAWSLIRCGVARGSISEAYKLVGHRQVRDTECPGDRLYQEIQTWPHWVAHHDIIPRTNSTKVVPTPK